MNRFFSRRPEPSARAAGLFGTVNSSSAMLRVRLGTTLAVCALLSAPLEHAAAQGAQKYGVQVSVLATSIGGVGGGSESGGIGLEPQFRINHLYRSAKSGVVSLGVGGQWTSHKSGSDEITITGVFIEPRWVPPLPFERVFPYAAVRVAALSQSSNFGTSSTGTAFGAGGGIAFVVNPRLNIDAGVALVRQSFGDFDFTRSDLSGKGSFDPFTTYAAKIGFSFGFPK